MPNVPSIAYIAVASGQAYQMLLNSPESQQLSDLFCLLEKIELLKDSRAV